jgi:hypothetical protein
MPGPVYAEASPGLPVWAAEALAKAASPAMTSHGGVGMTAYLISLALVGLIAIAVWEAFS